LSAGLLCAQLAGFLLALSKLPGRWWEEHAGDVVVDRARVVPLLREVQALLAASVAL
jgi:hypothetical protein